MPLIDIHTNSFNFMELQLFCFLYKSRLIQATVIQTAGISDEKKTGKKSTFGAVITFILTLISIGIWFYSIYAGTTWIKDIETEKFKSYFSKKKNVLTRHRFKAEFNVESNLVRADESLDKIKVKIKSQLYQFS